MAMMSTSSAARAPIPPGDRASRHNFAGTGKDDKTQFRHAVERAETKEGSSVTQRCQDNTALWQNNAGRRDTAWA